MNDEKGKRGGYTVPSLGIARDVPVTDAQGNKVNVQDKAAHDLFPKLIKDGLSEAIKNHLHAPISDLPPDLAEFLKQRLDGINFAHSEWDAATPAQRAKAAMAADESAKLRDAYKRQEDEKRAAGRYSLNEAAEEIAASGERFESMLSALLNAAKSGALTMHEPGRQQVYVYGENDKPRPHYEQATWRDLNNWLSQAQPDISFSFPDPAKQKRAYVTPKGITNAQVIQAFSGLHFTEKSWAANLPKPRKWLAECRLRRGSRAKNGPVALWDPIKIATALLEQPRGVHVSKLKRVFRDNEFLAEWRDDWEHRLSMLSDDSAP